MISSFFHMLRGARVGFVLAREGALALVDPSVLPPLARGLIRVGRLIVGETGAVEGNVSADYVEVRGRIVGGISGKQVKLIATAYVDGDITAEQMSIDIGAYFQGRVLQGRREAPAPTAPARPAPPAEPAPQIIDMKPPAA